MNLDACVLRAAGLLPELSQAEFEASLPPMQVKGPTQLWKMQQTSQRQCSSTA